MIREHDRVVLTMDLPKYGLQPGDVGIVVLVHGDKGYGVEFMTLGGDTVAVVSLAKNQVREVGSDEVQHARHIGPPAA
jgi:Domain of unknown function (DUF4926)